MKIVLASHNQGKMKEMQPILAGYGVGVFPDISATARRLVKWDKTFTPNAQNHQVYERMYGPWREMYKAQLKLADDRVTRFMWAAPGL